MFWYILFFENFIFFICFFCKFLFLIFLDYCEFNEGELNFSEDGVIVWLSVWWVFIGCVDIFIVWISLNIFCLLMFSGVIVDLIIVLRIGIVGGFESKFDLLCKLVKWLVNVKILFIELFVVLLKSNELWE